ncbi:MAG: iron dependent repressor, metal binding and dimerization domain protein, partial [Bacteroidia bacterium]|nr:iron dependent repressor, metal binding and dimerization domain protein [Bacteroidia bacterium]
GKESIQAEQLSDIQSIPQLKTTLKRLEKKQILSQVKGTIILNEKGKIAAREVIRKHRLWEIYLSKYFHLDSDHLHDDAEGIEHVITPEIEKHLITLLDRPEKDPHQSEIPY